MITQKSKWEAGNNLLFHAITHGDTQDVIALLEDKEAQPNCFNISGLSAMHMAVYYQHKDIVQILLRYGAEPNIRESVEVGFCTPLHRAIERNDFEICKMLLENGANPNIVEKNGFTSLHYAAQVGFADIVKLLIDHGVDIHKRDEYGFNAAYWAKTNNHQKVADLLPPPAKISMEEFHQFRVDLLEARRLEPPTIKKKKKKKKKK